MLSISHLPDDVLIEILRSVPFHDLVCHGRLVCSRWRLTIDSQTLWKSKCQLHGYMSKKLKRNPRDWKMFYYICHFKRNLLKNPCAEDEFNNWNLLKNSGDQWKVEDLPGNHGRPFPEENVRKYFVTSYGKCSKSQLIDLKKEGYSPELMDVSQPEIIVKDWYAARHDCGCWYYILVRLLSEDDVTLQEFSPSNITIEQWSDAEWRVMEHTFKNYGPGVRYIYFEHGGSDTQFWAGWYGIRLTNSSVTIGPEDLSTDPLPEVQNEPGTE